MGNLSLRAKIVLIVLAALLGMTVISIFSITATKRDLTEGRKEVIKSLVEGGHNLLAYYHGLETSGKLSREEAQRQAAEAVGASKGYWNRLARGATAKLALEPQGARIRSTLSLPMSFS